MAHNTPTPLRKLRVAISGGGLAGATLANALLDQPHLDVHIYESAPEFSERGAAVGLAVNAQRALSEIIPCVSELLDKAGAVSMKSTRLVIVCIQTLLQEASYSTDRSERDRAQRRV